MLTTKKDAEVINKINQSEEIKNAIQDVTGDVGRACYTAGSTGMLVYLSLGAAGVFVAWTLSNKVEKWICDKCDEAFKELGVE